MTISCQSVQLNTVYILIAELTKKNVKICSQLYYVHMTLALPLYEPMIPQGPDTVAVCR